MKSIIGNAKRQEEDIHRDTKKRIQKLKMDLLATYFVQLTQQEQGLFNQIFPHGVPKAKLNQALDLMERTIENKGDLVIEKLLQEMK